MMWLLTVSSVCYLFGASRVPIFVAGIIFQLVYLLQRSLSLGRLPLLGPHDTLTFFSLSIATMALITSFAHQVRRTRWFMIASGILAGLFTLCALGFKPSNMPLPQILDTLWFELHVVLAFFSYALFVVGGLFCTAFLIRDERAYLDTQFKTSLVGWSFFSASMVAGGIWGYYAWGTYWLWTPKELWTSILWLFYALLLHIRLKGARWDRATAWLGIAGVGVMLFTYLGVSMLMKSSHSF
jgi:ABC-type transport system involved in cytochrome c biogenesis permease subunit